MLNQASINIKYRVKDLVRTMDFYNILLGDSPADFYEGHAAYFLAKQQLILTFIEDPATAEQVYGNFGLEFRSDEDVYERFTDFTRKGFACTLKADYQSFGQENHAFSISDPNGICWQLGIKDKEVNTFKFFNFPLVNTVWDILKPL
jgi:uncharacterized glyoxalase superfamily protein PhnB